MASGVATSVATSAATIRRPHILPAARYRGRPSRRAAARNDYLATGRWRRFLRLPSVPFVPFATTRACPPWRASPASEAPTPTGCKPLPFGSHRRASHPVSPCPLCGVASSAAPTQSPQGAVGPARGPRPFDEAAPRHQTIFPPPQLHYAGSCQHHSWPTLLLQPYPHKSHPDLALNLDRQPIPTLHTPTGPRRHPLSPRTPAHLSPRQPPVISRRRPNLSPAAHAAAARERSQRHSYPPNRHVRATRWQGLWQRRPPSSSATASRCGVAPRPRRRQWRGISPSSFRRRLGRTIRRTRGRSRRHRSHRAGL